MEQVLPKHLGFIVDGNRRWARERGLPTLEGHKRGLALLEDMAVACFDRGIQFVSFYVFSTENWNRSKEEVAYLMKLLRSEVKKLTERCLKEDIKIAILGSKSGVPSDIDRIMAEAELATERCGRGVLGLCFNYGGRREIVEAIEKIEGDITEEKLSAALYHPEIPDCDMIVRTSGEQRLSGFMLWRASYAELMFLDEYWPEVSENTLDKILKEFSLRNRRFGK